MRSQDILYFSPNYKFTDLNWDDRVNLIKAFRDRSEGFYLKPAEELNRCKYAFASGVICVSTIDFLARIETGLDDVGKRFEEWVKSNIREFEKTNPDNRSQTLAHRFYDEFRNGLVHEGRIKNAGQFSYNYSELVKVEQSVMIINTEYLLNAIRESFNRYVDRVEKDNFAFQLFKCTLIRDFRRDVEYANR